MSALMKSIPQRLKTAALAALFGTTLLATTTGCGTGVYQTWANRVECYYTGDCEDLEDQFDDIDFDDDEFFFDFGFWGGDWWGGPGWGPPIGWWDWWGPPGYYF